MRSLFLSSLATSGFLLASAGFSAHAQEKQPLRLVQTIPMRQVRGRLDHMDVDVAGKRLFVAGLENGSVEVIDLQEGRWLRSISGFKKPQGIVYVPALNKLFVASGDDAMLRIFQGDTLELLDAIKLDLGPNRIAYDPRKKLLYVGYGGKDAGKDYGEVAVIDAAQNKHLSDIQVAAHPAELLLNHSGSTLFAFIPVPGEVQVIDTQRRAALHTWPVSSERPGDAAFDEASNRLLIATRNPPLLIAMDSRSGTEMDHQPTVEGMDGAYFDSRHKRVYVSGGRGFDVGSVYVYQQLGPDRYETIAKIPTRPGAGTSFWSPELHRYYVAAPAHDNAEAAILVFEPQP
jgi:DNA-binding beta-propeller fold protein YncE